MIGMIELCALNFLLKEPLPHTLEAIYKKEYPCKNFVPLQKTLATDKISNINKYFPTQKYSWPLIVTPFKKRALQNIKSWEKKGVTPGFLLPDHNLKNTQEFEQIAEIRKTGAIPIVTVKNTLPRTLKAARYYWCMHGACPAGWYLPNGLDNSIQSAPEGLYLTATHWYKREDLPLPNHTFSINNKRIIPTSALEIITIKTKPNLNQDIPSPYHFTPKIDTQWQWLGVNFKYNQADLETNFLGKMMLSFGEVSFLIWDNIHPININLFSIINENFSWMVLIIAGFNILLLFIAMFRKRKDVTK